MDAAVAKAYGGKRKIAWMEVYAGEKSFKKFNSWLPDETVEAFREFLVGIKGPLTTPIGGGIRSLNVALRQMLDLYVCLRPVRWFKGVPSPVKHPEKVDMVIFRENTEDIYAGIEFEQGTRGLQEVPGAFQGSVSQGIRQDPLPRIERHRHQAGFAGRQRTADPLGHRVRPDIKRKSVTLVHKGNIMKYTEGAFRNWGYALAERDFGGKVYTWEQWEKTKKAKGEEAANGEQKAALASGKILIKDAIADITLQQVLTRPDEFDVIATLNLNGDYLSDALAAQVGGIGIAPGGNINYMTRPRRLRGHPRHRPQIRRPGQGQPRLGHPLRRDDAPLPGLDRSRRPHHQGHGRRHRRQDRDLRFRPPDGRGQGSEVQRSSAMR